MEGLLDATLRDVLTRTGGIDRCVSEFIRVTNTLLPERAFVHVVPELQRRGLFRRQYQGHTLREHLGLQRLWLHAASLSLPHPHRAGDCLHIASPLSSAELNADWQRVLSEPWQWAQADARGRLCKQAATTGRRFVDRFRQFALPG